LDTFGGLSLTWSNLVICGKLAWLNKSQSSNSSSISSSNSHCY